MRELPDFVAVFLASALGAWTFLKFFAEKSIAAGVDKALHQEKLLIEAELVFRQRQLEELYGPVYANLRLGARLYPLWMEGRFKEVNADIINLFKKQNDEITTILKTKAHLIDGNQYPPEFTKFMTSATIWGLYCSRKEEPWVPQHVAEIEDVKWPREFQHHIYEKTEELKRRLDDLLRKYRTA